MVTPTDTSVLFTQRAKKQVTGLSGQLIIHLARLLDETVAGKQPDHQGDPNRDRDHWWKEIKNFIRLIRSKGFSDAQLRKILEDAFGNTNVDAVIEALRQAAKIMGESIPRLF